MFDFMIIETCMVLGIQLFRESLSEKCARDNPER